MRPKPMPQLFDSLGVGDPDADLVDWATCALWFSDSTTELGIAGAAPASLGFGQETYMIALHAALDTPAKGLAGLAAKAVLALHEMPCDAIRANGDLAGIAFLALAEDLIAAVI